MDILQAISMIQSRFDETGSPVAIPLQKGGQFTATLEPNGVRVDNLHKQPFLPWAVFQEAVCTMIRHDGKADRGNAMNAKLGDPALSLDSIEGHIAHVVYGQQVGDSVFRRISPVAAILIWAGICTSEPGHLLLRG